MKIGLPPALVRRSLDAHSAMGLVIGLLMYLICLTGSLAALAEAFERWEQPEVEEFVDVDPALAVTAFDALVARSPDVDSHWVVYPTPELPRLHVADGESEWFVNRDGSLGAEPVEGWTTMLRDLHIHLHLPQNLGLILVSAMGAILLALIFSGLFAHPRLFKDAFKLRLGGSRRLEQADLHNRLSVWALPFHITIALTGAFYGLVGLLLMAAAAAFYEGDRNAVIDAVYGADPVIDAEIRAPDIPAAMAYMAAQHPDDQTLYVVVHHHNTRQQFIEVAAVPPGRLAYSEIYRFDAAGQFMNSQGLTSGPTGRQVLYSLYRIHFGYFGGQWTRIAYLLLGLSLTIVAVTGVNVWLSRRGRRDRLDLLWCSCVWGAPLALAASAAIALYSSLPSIAVFLAVFAASLAGAWLTPEPAVLRRWLQMGLSGVLFAVVLPYYIVFEGAATAPASGAINAALLVVAIGFLWWAWRPALVLSAEPLPKT